MFGSVWSAMNRLQQRLILITHAAIVTLLVVSWSNLPVRWSGPTGGEGQRYTSDAISDTPKSSRLDQLWRPLIASLNRHKFSETNDWPRKAPMD